MVEISLPRILEKTGPGRQVELPLRTHFSPKNFKHLHIKPWRELSFAVSFSTVAHQRQETQWQKKPKLSGYKVTEDWKTDKAASPFSSSPSSFPRTILSPYAAKHSQPSNICVAFLLVPLVIDVNFTVSKWESSELKQPKDRLLPVVFLSVSLLHFSALIIMGD